jgi:hypothetical protein
MKAFVEAEYDNDGPAMAGFNYGQTLRQAEIVEVDAETPQEAEQAVRKKFEEPGYKYHTLRRVAFKRWA